VADEDEDIEITSTEDDKIILIDDYLATIPVE
jgi:hypothetical protein